MLGRDWFSEFKGMCATPFSMDQPIWLTKVLVAFSERIQDKFEKNHGKKIEEIKLKKFTIQVEVNLQLGNRDRLTSDGNSDGDAFSDTGENLERILIEKNKNKNKK